MMRSNIIVKLLAGGGVLLLVFAVMKFSNPELATIPIGSAPVSAAERNAGGMLESDTDEEVLQHVAVDLGAAHSQLKILQMQSAVLMKENLALEARTLNLAKGLSTEIDEKVQDSISKQQEAMSAQREELTELLKSLKESDTPVNTQTGSNPKATYPGALYNDDGTVWIPAKNSRGGDEKGLFNRFMDSAPVAKIQSATGVNEQSSVRPVYTVAKNSTLMSSVSMSNLIGRIPKNGNIADPYNFKIKIGAENLIANDHRIPGLDHAIAWGVARGDKTLSCVSGSITSITFLFHDTRIVTLPPPSNISNGEGKTEDLEIAVLADEWGNPCIPGKLITNDEVRILQAATAAGIGAAAEAAASSQTTTSIGGGGGVSGVTGSKTDFIVSESVSGGSDEIVALIREQMKNEFAAVVVQKGAPIALHITEELRIDYDENGRLAKYSGVARAIKPERRLH